MTDPLHDPKIETAMKAFIADNPEIETREDAVTRILEIWFTGNGYLPHGQEGTRPEDLDASNDD